MSSDSLKSDQKIKLFEISKVINKVKIVPSNNDANDNEKKEQRDLNISLNRLSNHFQCLVETQESIKQSTNNQEISSIRGNIIDWLLEISDKIKALNQETLFKAIFLFDSYLSKINVDLVDIDAKKLHFISVVCFFISYKFQETSVMNLDFVQNKLLSNQYEKSEIVALETDILIKLNFQINFPTVNSFLEIFIELLLLHYKDKSLIKIFRIIYNFVCKISLFVDQFIINEFPLKVSIICFKTSMISMKNLGYINDKQYLEIENIINTFVEKHIEFEKLTQLANGLFLAILKQEQLGLHKFIFSNYYNKLKKSQEENISYQNEKIEILI
jgi:hypothetical protein